MEIDLKKTPLSEIDLSKIDYEKSYVIHKNCKYLIIDNSIEYFEDGLYKMNSNPRRGFLFYPNGNHYYKEATIHLFYKEVRECKTCEYAYNPFAVIRHCGECSGYSKWIPIDEGVEKPIKPKESVTKKVEACTRCIHLSCNRINEPCCSCNKLPYGVRNNYEWVQEPNPHPIIIEYQDLGDTVKIVKIEGVMNSLNIITHAGDRVYQEYMSGSPCMISRNNGVSVFWKVDRNLVSEFLIAGATYSKQHIFDVVNQMKLSAKRLAQLIKDSKKKSLKSKEMKDLHNLKDFYREDLREYFMVDYEGPEEYAGILFNKWLNELSLNEANEIVEADR